MTNPSARAMRIPTPENSEPSVWANSTTIAAAIVHCLTRDDVLASRLITSWTSSRCFSFASIVFAPRAEFRILAVEFDDIDFQEINEVYANKMNSKTNSNRLNLFFTG